MALMSNLTTIRSSTRSLTSLSQLLPVSLHLRIKGSSSSGTSSSFSVPEAAGGSLRLVFLGGPGVGKGTYASVLSKQLGIPHISTGDLVREELSASKSSSCAATRKLQETVRSLVNQGKLLPDDIVMALLSKRLRKLEPKCISSSAGFILDGFPRTLNQARTLDEALENSGSVTVAVNLHMEEEALVAKCLGRRICAHCGQDYNLCHLDIDEANRRVFLPARLPQPGSACEGALRVRDDDSSQDVVRKRLYVYAHEKAAVEGHYRRQGKLREVDVGGGMEQTYPVLLQAVTGIHHNTTADIILHPRRTAVMAAGMMAC